MATQVNKPQLNIIIYSLFNINCSIAIVLINKWVYVHLGFPNLTLTFLHFVTTFLGLFICERLNVFNVKTVNIWDIWPLVFCFCGFVIFTNLSLQFNTVGTYQLAKVMTTPTIAFIQEYFFDTSISAHIKYTLFCITFGVILAVFNDIKFNLLGTIYATVGVLITSLYQILVSSKQADLRLDHMQLLYYQSQLSSVILFASVLIFEHPWTYVSSNLWSITDLGMVLVTCVVAFFLNLSIYWIIGNTSPLTYNMIGHLKYCLTTTGGYILFDEPFSFLQALGVALTLSGVTAYTHIKYKENNMSSKSLEV